MKKNHFISGEWNVTCDVCSKKIKAHEARQRWDGFIVCGDCYENRHPQDFVKAQTDKISVPFQRPVPTYIFTVIPYNLYWDSGYSAKDYIIGDDLF
jgi:hypothetical protein